MSGTEYTLLYLLHRDLECDVGGVLLEVPEADQVLCVDRREVLVVQSLLV